VRLDSRSAKSGNDHALSPGGSAQLTGPGRSGSPGPTSPSGDGAVSTIASGMMSVSTATDWQRARAGGAFHLDPIDTGIAPPRQPVTSAAESAYTMVTPIHDPGMFSSVSEGPVPFGVTPVDDLTAIDARNGMSGSPITASGSGGGRGRGPSQSPVARLAAGASARGSKGSRQRF